MSYNNLISFSALNQQFSNEKEYNTRRIKISQDPDLLHVSHPDNEDHEHTVVFLSAVRNVSTIREKCINISFHTGGDIDIKFDSDKICEEWILALETYLTSVHT